MEPGGFVYILASRPHGTLYIGVTNDLPRRVSEHRQGLVPGFTRRYRVHRLVHWEAFGDIREAIAREKQLKAWHRDWKIGLIEEANPDWRDRFAAIVDAPEASPAPRHRDDPLDPSSRT